VVRIGSHPADSEEDQRLQRAHLLLGGPQVGHIHLGGALGDGPDGGDLETDVVRIEIDIGERGEQGFHDDGIGLRGDVPAVQGPGQADEGPGQFVLQHRHLRCLPAYASRTGATLAPRGLLALETEHATFHDIETSTVFP